MSEINDKVKRKVWRIVNSLRHGDLGVDEGMAEILSIPEIARALFLLEVVEGASSKRYVITVVDREAKVPQRQKLPKGHLLLEAEDKNDIYLNGQIFAQEKMLEEGWGKEVKEWLNRKR